MAPCRFTAKSTSPAGGPDGGDGGRGGDVVLKTDENMSTLMDFRYKRKYAAENGVDGGARMRTGKDGQSLVIKVPRGTLVRDAETGAIIQDMTGVESLCHCARRQWRLGQQAFRHTDATGPAFCQKRPAR